MNVTAQGQPLDQDIWGAAPTRVIKWTFAEHLVFPIEYSTNITDTDDLDPDPRALLESSQQDWEPLPSLDIAMGVGNVNGYGNLDADTMQSSSLQAAAAIIGSGKTAQHFKYP